MLTCGCHPYIHIRLSACASCYDLLRKLEACFSPKDMHVNMSASR